MTSENERRIEDWEFSQKYIDAQRYILFKIFGEAPEIATAYLDMVEHKDMWLPKLNQYVGCRVRKPKFNTFNDVTIKSHHYNVDPPTDTEYPKIILMESYYKHKLDWFLYCWTGHDLKISRWVIVNLDRQRELIDTGKVIVGEHIEKEVYDKDGKLTYKFYHFDVGELRILGAIHDEGRGVYIKG